MKYEIQNIQQLTFNGRKVLAFDLYELQPFDKVFAGRFTAPANTPRHQLINHAI